MRKKKTWGTFGSQIPFSSSSSVSSLSSPPALRPPAPSELPQQISFSPWSFSWAWSSLLFPCFTASSCKWQTLLPPALLLPPSRALTLDILEPILSPPLGSHLLRCAVHSRASLPSGLRSLSPLRASLRQPRTSSSFWGPKLLLYPFC